MTPEELAAHEARLEEERLQKEEEEKERLRQEAEEKDRRDRLGVKMSLDKWKVRKTDKVLNLKGKNFLPDDIETIGRALMYTDTYEFEKIDLSRQAAIKDLELETIFAIGGVGKNVSITSIDLSNTKLTDIGTKVLQRTLMTNKTLTSLDCRDCGEITTEGARRLLNLVLHVPPPKPPEPTPLFELLDNSDPLPGIVQPVIRDWSQIYSDILLPPSPKDLPPIDAESEAEISKSPSRMFKSSVGRIRSFGGFGKRKSNEDEDAKEGGDDEKQPHSNTVAVSPSRKFKRTPPKSWLSAKNKLKSLSLGSSSKKNVESSDSPEKNKSERSGVLGKALRNPMLGSGVASDTEADLLLAERLADNLASQVYGSPQRASDTEKSEKAEKSEAEDEVATSNSTTPQQLTPKLGEDGKSKSRKLKLFSSVRNKLRISSRRGESKMDLEEKAPDDEEPMEEPKKLSSSALLTIQLGEQMGKELGMEKGEMAKITNSEATFKEAKDKGMLNDEATTKGILKKSESARSKAKSRGGSIEEDETSVQGAHDLPLSPPPLKTPQAREKEISFGTEFKVDFHTDSSPSKLNFGSTRKGISFSNSTISTKSAGGDEKMADELAAKLANMVGEELGEEEGGGETKLLAAATGSVGAAKSWRERAKRSLSLKKKMSGPKSFQLSSPTNETDGEEEKSPKKSRKSWGGLKSAMKSSFKLKKGVSNGAADEVGLEADHDVMKEMEAEPEPETEEDHVDLATEPLCPSVIEICGIPIRMMLDGGMEVLDLEGCR